MFLLPGKIEIKIVRPGAEGKEEDTRWLTDEDTRNLKEIFFNILVRHRPTSRGPSTRPAVPVFVEPHPPVRGEAKPQLLLGRICQEAISLVPASLLGLRTPLDPAAQDFPWLNPSFLPGAGSRRGQ